MTTTQNCAECGTRAEPGQSFCDACGAVLSWTDRAGARRGAERAGSDAAQGSGAGAAVSAGAGAGAAAAAGQSAAGAVGGAYSGGRTPGAVGQDDFGQGDDAGQAGTQRDLLGTQDRGATPAGEVSEAGTGSVNGGAGSTDAPETNTEPTAPSASDTPHATSAGQEPGAYPDAAPAPVDDTAPTEPVPAAYGEDIPHARADGDGMSDRARQLLVPVADPEQRPAAEPSVAPVLPGRPVPQRPQVVRAPGEELGADGGTPCPWCSTPNRSDRHFCARCAMPMTKEEQGGGVRRSWWRRMLDFRNQETPWAGDRPRLRRAFDRILSWLGAAIVLALLVVVAFQIPAAVQATKDHFAKRASIAPDSYSASRFYAGHPAKLAFDKWNNTWWGPGVNESGQGQWIEATFGQPVRLLDLLITSGVSTHPDQLQQQALPHHITATITDDKGRTFTREITLDQTAGAQHIPFRVGEVTRVRFTIDTAYFPDKKKQVAIAEIEFFGPSSAS
ncbi:MAG: zinc ribbon domain-containing protein [Streptomyces sp.]|nr:zinc ribbon domain-containing protein [Streptomyces sp.]